MGTRVTLPPGCSGFRCQDGTLYSAKKGTSVVVEDQHAVALARGQHVRSGLLSTSSPVTLGTKRGRWCNACSRLWQAWSAMCPRCGAETEEA